MSNTKTIIGFLAGAFVGASIAVLFAPASGSDTRKYLQGAGGYGTTGTGNLPTANLSLQASEDKIRSVMHHAKSHVTSNS